MNADKFEQRLREQTVRPIPDDWRSDILNAARKASVPHASPLTNRPPSWFRELLWPCPQAWAGLAVAWLLILVMHFFSSGASEVVEARSSRFGKELLAALSERRLQLAELIGTGEAPEPAKPAPPRPRSDRRSKYATA